MTVHCAIGVIGVTSHGVYDELTMTAKEQLRQAIEDLSEAEAADVLVLIRNDAPDGEEATRILAGIDGAFDTIDRGLADVRAGRTRPLDTYGRGAG